jgi:predicted transposase YbfD/YdcC
MEQAVVSNDTIGCQRAIAQQILKGGGDYVLAVKDVSHPAVKVRQTPDATAPAHNARRRKLH